MIILMEILCSCGYRMLDVGSGGPSHISQHVPHELFKYVHLLLMYICTVSALKVEELHVG